MSSARSILPSVFSDTFLHHAFSSRLQSLLHTRLVQVSMFDMWTVGSKDTLRCGHREGYSDAALVLGSHIHCIMWFSQCLLVP